MGVTVHLVVVTERFLQFVIRGLLSLFSAGRGSTSIGAAPLSSSTSMGSALASTGSSNLRGGSDATVKWKFLHRRET